MKNININKILTDFTGSKQDFILYRDGLDTNSKDILDQSLVFIHPRKSIASDKQSDLGSYIYANGVFYPMVVNGATIVTPDQIKNFVYSKTYNNIDSDITGITYDDSLKCIKVLSTNTVTIAVPEEHVYTVTFDVQLLQNANTKLYIIDDKGTETEHSIVIGKNDIVVTSDKIKFRVNDTMWIKNITVTGLDIEIPKKVSQLENDLKYNHLDVSEPETIVVNIPNKL